MAKWIQKIGLKKGRVKRALGVPEDQPIPESKRGALRRLAERKGSLGFAARLAIRFKSGELKKKKKE